MRKFLITLFLLSICVPAFAASAVKIVDGTGTTAMDETNHRVNVNVADASSGTQTNEVLVEGGIAEDSASSQKPIHVGGIAESTVPTAVADGDAIGLNVNTYGEPRIAGYNSATGAIDATIISGPPLVNHTWNIGSATLDDNPTSLTSSTVSLGSFRNAGFLISYDETDTGNDTQIAVTVDVSDDNSTWYSSSFIAGGSLVATVAMGSDSGTDDENFHIYLDKEAVGAPYVRCVLTCTGCAGGGDDQAAVSIEFTGQK